MPHPSRHPFEPRTLNVYHTDVTGLSELDEIADASVVTGAFEIDLFNVGCGASQFASDSVKAAQKMLAHLTFRCSGAGTKSMRALSMSTRTSVTRMRSPRR